MLYDALCMLMTLLMSDSLGAFPRGQVRQALAISGTCLRKNPKQKDRQKSASGRPVTRFWQILTKWRFFVNFVNFLSNCVKAWVIQSSTPFQKRASSTNPPALESHLQQLTHRKCTAAPCGTASPLHRFTEHLRFLRFLQSSVLFLRQFRCFWTLWCCETSRTNQPPEKASKRGANELSDMISVATRDSLDNLDKSWDSNLEEKGTQALISPEVPVRHIWATSQCASLRIS